MNPKIKPGRSLGLKMTVSVVMVLTFLPVGFSTAWAQATSYIKIVEFSKSGKYLSVTREIQQGVGGYSIITLRFLNVPRNSFVSRKVTLNETYLNMNDNLRRPLYKSASGWDAAMDKF